MFRVPDAGKIVVQHTSLRDRKRVWLDLPLDTSNSGFNLIEVSVRLEDLERAIANYKLVEKEESHA